MIDGQCIRQRGRTKHSSSVLPAALNNGRGAKYSLKRRQHLFFNPVLLGSPYPIGGCMHAFARDFRFAFRQLWKAPAFSGTVILTLALGIGATTAIFSLVEGILLRPLPFSNPDRLVLLGDHLGEGPGISVTAREIGTYANVASAFAALGGSITASYEISGGAVPEELNAARFTAGVFPTLGVEPMLGRVFTQQEEDTHQPLAVISYALWQNRYHLDPAVLGSSIALDRRPYTIIGVMPRTFEFPIEDGRLNQAQLWIPMSLTAEELSEEHAGFWGYQMVARLKDGVTVPQAAQDADRVAKQIMRNLPAAQSAIAIRGDVTPLMEYSVAEIRPLLRTLFSAVSLVLLIGCFNVAGLMLVRAIRRRSEYAVRLALGAPSRVIVRESVLEGLVLGAIGGLLGLAFAAIAIRIALQLLPESMPRVDSISIDATVSGFATVLALITGTICGLAPALAALRTNVAESLKEGARTGTAASNHAWLRSASGCIGDRNRFSVADCCGRISAQLAEDGSRRSRFPSRSCSGCRLSLASSTIFHGGFLRCLSARGRRPSLWQARSRSGWHHFSGSRSRRIWRNRLHHRRRTDGRLEVEVRHVRDYIRRLFPCHGHSAGRWPVLHGG